MKTRPNKLSEKAQLIKGLGASSWFTIEVENDKYRIKRFSTEGKLECSRLFTTQGDFNINKEYKFTYLSHCKECTILQDNQKLKFYLDED